MCEQLKNGLQDQKICFFLIMISIRGVKMKFKMITKNIQAIQQYYMVSIKLVLLQRDNRQHRVKDDFNQRVLYISFYKKSQSKR